MCFSTAPTVSHSFFAIAALLRPSAISVSTSRSLGVSSESGSSWRRRPISCAIDLRIEGRPAVGDPAHGLDELADVGDALLQEVADADSAGCEQVARVALLDVLREHEDRRLGDAGARLDRGAQALVGVGRGHANVDDREIGAVTLDGDEERIAVPDALDDLDLLVGEQPREALAQQHRVLCDHDAHGSSARTIVGPPAGLETVSVPSTVAARVVRPSSPPPGSIRAPPTPLSSTSTTIVSVLARDAHLEPRRRGVLGRVRQRLGDDEVRRRLDRDGRPRRRGRPRSRRGSGFGAASAESAASRPRSVRIAGWMPAREVAELRERLLRVLVRLLDEGAGALRVGVELGAGAPEVDRERRQPLLRAVVEVALDPPSLGNRSVDRLGALLRQLARPARPSGGREAFRTVNACAAASRPRIHGRSASRTRPTSEQASASGSVSTLKRELVPELEAGARSVVRRASRRARERPPRPSPRSTNVAIASGKKTKRR